MKNFSLRSFISQKLILSYQYKQSLKSYTLLVAIIFAGLNTAHAQYGALDTSFDKDGIVITDVQNKSMDRADAVIIQPDGKILAAGSSGNGVYGQMCVIRYNIDGSIDNSFGVKGVAKASSSPTYSSHANALALQADGKIIAAGSDSCLAMARYNTDGSLDASFGKGGIILETRLDTISFAKAVLIDAEGNILVGGSSMVSLPDGMAFVVARYLNDGTPDPEFGNNGLVIIDVAPDPSLMGLDNLTALALQPDGKIVISGMSGANATLIRLNSNGSLDKSFGVDGIILTNFTTNGYSGYSALAILPNGKILATGHAFDGKNYFILSRYDQSGSPDPGFGTNGLVMVSYDPASYGGSAILLQADGKIITGGNFFDNGTAECALVRYNANGTPDNTFGNNGMIKTRIGNYSYLESMAMQVDGKLVIAGSTDEDFFLARYSMNLTDVADPRNANIKANVFPNPSQGKAMISYTLQQSSTLSINMYSIDGKRIKEITAPTQQPSGQHIAEVDMTGLASGAYYIDITTGVERSILKVVKE